MAVQPEIVGRKSASAPVPIPAFLERNRILSVAQMAEFTGYSVAHLRRMYRTGKFPRPISLGGRKLGWPAHVAQALTAAEAS